MSILIDILEPRDRDATRAPYMIVAGASHVRRLQRAERPGLARVRVLGAGRADHKAAITIAAV